MLITQYANRHKDDIYIDKENKFFQVCSSPLSEAKLANNPYFVHGPGWCTYLNDICEKLDIEVDAKNVRKELQQLFIEKGTYHFVEFMKKMRWLWIALVVVIIFMKLRPKSKM